MFRASVPIGARLGIRSNLTSDDRFMAVYNFTFLQGLKFGKPGAGGILVTTLNPIVAYGIGNILDAKLQEVGGV